MESRRFYTSPVNHHNFEAWEPLAVKLEEVVREKGSGLSVDVGREPVFHYGADGGNVLDALYRRELPPRTVRIDLWSSVVFYETLCVAFGSGVPAREKNGISRRLDEHELSEQTLLRTWDGPYDDEAPQVYGYRLSGIDDEAMAILLAPFDEPIFIGPRWMILDENEAVDERDFELVSDEGDAAVFLGRSREAREQLWKRATPGDGMFIVFGDDPAIDALADRFEDTDDVRILLAEHPSAGMRVSVDRGHQDDHLLVVYTPPGEPEIDRELLFVV